MTSSTKRDAANRYSHTWERNEQITLHGYSSGPAHKPVHTSIVSINGHEFGRGEASTKSDAKELAARRAIKQLSGHFWS
ncbi:hypothetical protein DL96DRAFT_1616682 [Flagelloscypha sp. PMI_526]|nr:hypothetical protein DL96DRAFT_1616682 [Flagelloscypha sp. PMI_526]